MKTSGLLVLRADADANIGTGHVTRCLALAQAWQDTGGCALFVASAMPSALVARLRRENIALAHIAAARGSAEDAAATLGLAQERGAAWVVLDGYCFDAAYADALRAGGLRLLALDDMNHLDRYAVDVLLNQNLSARAEAYSGKVGKGTTLLLGPVYSLLRREFRVAPPRSTATPHAALRVLVSFGGGDAENYTSAVLQNLAASGRRELEVIALAGAANPHVFSLRRLAATLPFRCDVRVNVENVAAVMSWADVAITAGGSTVWELAALRLPALIGALEDNQLAGLDALGAVPFFRAQPVAELLARNLASELAALVAVPVGETGFDALGAERVVAFLQSRVALPFPAFAIA